MTHYRDSTNLDSTEIERLAHLPPALIGALWEAVDCLINSHLSCTIGSGLWCQRRARSWRRVGRLLLRQLQARCPPTIARLRELRSVRAEHLRPSVLRSPPGRPPPGASPQTPLEIRLMGGVQNVGAAHTATGKQRSLRREDDSHAITSSVLGCRLRTAGVHL